MQLKYISPIKSGLKATILISFLFIALVLYLAFVQFGTIVIIIFAGVYILFMAFLVNSMKNHYLEIDEENKLLNIHRLFSYIELNINDIKLVDIIETKHSYTMKIETNELNMEFTLTGSMYLVEPPVIPFIRKLHDLNNTIGFGEYCIGIFNGDTNMESWSIKMYYTFWTHMAAATGYFMLLLVFLKIVT